MICTVKPCYVYRYFGYRMCILSPMTVRCFDWCPFWSYDCCQVRYRFVWLLCEYTRTQLRRYVGRVPPQDSYSVRLRIFGFARRYYYHPFNLFARSTASWSSRCTTKRIPLAHILIRKYGLGDFGEGLLLKRSNENVEYMIKKWKNESMHIALITPLINQ